MKKAIVVTGTPGTGKTTLAKRLSKLLGYPYVDVNDIILRYGLSEGYDKERDCKIVDTKELNKILIDIIRSSDSPLVIDSHLAHFLPKRFVSLCIITRCNLKLLRSRLKRRHYSDEKIAENLESEIMEVIPDEVFKKKHNFFFVDTDKKIDYKKLVKKIILACSE